MNIKKYIEDFDKVCVSYSGGVDSTFLLAVCADVIGKENVLAITVNSSMFPKRELAQAEKMASDLGVTHIIIDADEYSVPEFVENGKDRCYYCKKAIFTKVIAEAKEHNISTIFDGTNASDATDYRPGKRALAELGVISPLANGGLTKDQIRKFSVEYNLLTANMPSRACLASRVPYGDEITPIKLSIIEQAEYFLIDKGYNEVRVRYHGDIARIEIPTKNMQNLLLEKDIIVDKFKQLGFTYITLDLQGFRSGSMNEILDVVADDSVRP